MFTSLTFSFLCLIVRIFPSNGQNYDCYCRWEGEAPLCDGADTCRSNGGYPERESRNADGTKQRCFSGFHAYCCYGFCPEDEGPVPECNCIWEGTAPFCAGVSRCVDQGGFVETTSVDAQGTKSTCAVGLHAYCCYDYCPTEEPTPSPTPQPTPGPTPSPTPSPTPDPTPEPTPKPTREVVDCPRHRKPWHLISDEERLLYINGFLELHEQGVITEMANIHATAWNNGFDEIFFPWHRYFVLEV